MPSQYRVGLRHFIVQSARSGSSWLWRGEKERRSLNSATWTAGTPGSLHQNPWTAQGAAARSLPSIAREERGWCTRTCRARRNRKRDDDHSVHCSFPRLPEVPGQPLDILPVLNLLAPYRGNSLDSVICACEGACHHPDGVCVPSESHSIYHGPLEVVAREK